MKRLSLLVTAIAALGAPLLAQSDIKDAVVRHLIISRDFTLKVAGQMPEADYNFKLTPAQMSFGEQMVHLAQGFDYFLAPIFGKEPNPGKPPTMRKSDVMVFVKKSFDAAIETASKLTPGQLSKSYESEEGTLSGLELLIGLLNHTTHHRASAEMYLRAKGITPSEYQF